jgi:hypothetical protein
MKSTRTSSPRDFSILFTLFISLTSHGYSYTWNPQGAESADLDTYVNQTVHYTSSQTNAAQQAQARQDLRNAYIKQGSDIGTSKRDRANNNLTIQQSNNAIGQKEVDSANKSIPSLENDIKVLSIGAESNAASFHAAVVNELSKRDNMQSTPVPGTRNLNLNGNYTIGNTDPNYSAEEAFSHLTSQNAANYTATIAKAAGEDAKREAEHDLQNYTGDDKQELIDKAVKAAVAHVYANAQTPSIGGNGGSGRALNAKQSSAVQAFSSKLESVGSTKETSQMAAVINAYQQRVDNTPPAKLPFDSQFAASDNTVDYSKVQARLNRGVMAVGSDGHISSNTVQAQLEMRAKARQMPPPDNSDTTISDSSSSDNSSSDSSSSPRLSGFQN